MSGTDTGNEDRHAHWKNVWTTRDADKVSWFQADPALSMKLISQAGRRRDSAIIDVGGGRSPLAGLLVEQGYSNVAVLDIAEAALAQAHQDLGGLGDDVTWIAADVLDWQPVPGLFDVWHDRALCHFFTTPEDQAAYARTLGTALAPDGIAIIATFALDGPERCSGLNVARHDGASLSAMLGTGFVLEQELADTHLTPSGAEQRFCWCVFRRL